MTLVAGRVVRDTPYGVNRIDVATTIEMKDVLAELLETHDGLVMAAAPADYAPAEYCEEKIKKSGETLSLTLVKNPDILKSLKQKLEDKIVVGFAAESHQLLENAQKKLVEKHLDFIVANNIASKDTGFASNYNAATIIYKDGHQEIVPKQLKSQLADKILDEMQEIRKAKKEEG